MYSLISSWISALESPNKLFGQRFGQKSLADAGWPKQTEGADRAARVFKIGARAAQRLAYSRNGFLLANDHLAPLPLQL